MNDRKINEFFKDYVIEKKGTTNVLRTSSTIFDTLPTLVLFIYAG